MTNEHAQAESGSGTYIAAFILANIASNIVSRVLEPVFFSGKNTVDAIMAAMWIATPVGIAATVAVVLGVYALFPNIRVAKVMPWFWGLGGLATVIVLLITANVGVLPAMFYVLAIGEFVATMLALTFAFKFMGRL